MLEVKFTAHSPIEMRSIAQMLLTSADTLEKAWAEEEARITQFRGAIGNVSQGALLSTETGLVNEMPPAVAADADPAPEKVTRKRKSKEEKEAETHNFVVEFTRLTRTAKTAGELVAMHTKHLVEISALPKDKQEILGQHMNLLMSQLNKAPVAEAELTDEEDDNLDPGLGDTTEAKSNVTELRPAPAALTADSVLEKLRAYGAEHGLNAMLEILASFDVKRFSEVAEARWPELVAKLDALS